MTVEILPTKITAWVRIINCASDEFCCNDGTCIPASWECDGMDDCTDGEDKPLTCNNNNNDNGGGGRIPGCSPPHAKVLTPDKQWRT